MTPTMRILLGAGLLLALGAPAAAQDLERLFLTPEQRATLDARRRARVPDKPPPAVVVQSPKTRFEGQVRRSSGRSTLWIGGQTVRDGAAPEGMSVAPHPSDPGRVSISVSENDRSVELKVGQVLDRSTLEIRDPVRDGGRVAESPPAQASSTADHPKEGATKALKPPPPLIIPPLPGLGAGRQ